MSTVSLPMVTELLLKILGESLISEYVTKIPGSKGIESERRHWKKRSASPC